MRFYEKSFKPSKMIANLNERTLFQSRHNAPTISEISEMIQTIGVSSLDRPLNRFKCNTNRLGASTICNIFASKHNLLLPKDISNVIKSNIFPQFKFKKNFV